MSRGSNIEITEETKKRTFPFQAWKVVFTNVLNPKATLYFLSLFTFVIKPETSLNPDNLNNNNVLG